MLAIFKKEMRSYFTGAIGYAFLVIFLAVGAALFCLTTLLSMRADVSTYFIYMMIFSGVMLPLLTMKSFSEERKIKTEQLVLTSPVSLVSMVMGKFLAATAVFAGATLVSSLSFVILYRYASVKTAMLFGNFIALLLVGMTFISIGMFVSSLTENQLAAAVGTIGILLFFMLISLLNNVIPFYFLRFILNGISIYARFVNFTNGIFDVASLVYYLSICAVFLFLTVRVFARRRHV